MLALATAQRWARGARLFAFLFPCVGFLARLVAGSDPAAWPVLLFAGFAAGWAFRFVYDFDTRPDPSGPDDALRALLVIWGVAVLLAAAEARTVWALWHGLALRVVNGQGLADTTAIRESLLSFGALASGAVWFLMLRRSGDAIRRRALAAALAGTAVSAAAALGQRVGLLPAERHPFWRMTGRLSGGAADPNSLGMLCALALVAGAGVWAAGGRRAKHAVAPTLAAVGLWLSGSRSGLLLAAGSAALLFVLRRRARTARVVGLVAAAAAVVYLAVLLSSGRPGTVGSRLASSFDPSQPLAYRISVRPILWRAAWRMFRRHPVQGAGMGVFTWRLPDLLAEEGLRWKMRDNPGSAYFQALAETGALGLLATVLFLAALARDAVRRVTRGDGDAAADASALAALAFAGVLAVGSHWLAADTSLLFFLLASVAARRRESRPWPPRGGLAASVAVFAAAAFAGALATNRADVAFRYDSRLGFYPVERASGGGRFQWTRRNFAVSLVPRERRMLALGNFSPLGRPVELVAQTEGRVIYRRRIAPGAIVSLRLDGGSAGGVLRFAASEWFVPRRLGIHGGDRRELALESFVLGPR